LRAFRALQDGGPGPAVAARGPPEALPQAVEYEIREPQPAAALFDFLRVKPRLDKAAPAGAVDSMGVPGLFCLWILNYLRCVGNVFSFRFLHLHYRDTTLT
jgi:hypothetical protein